MSTTTGEPSADDLANTAGEPLPGPNKRVSRASRFYVSYYRSSDHPMKLRMERWLRSLLRLDHVYAESTYGVRYRLMPDDFVQLYILRHGVFEPDSVALMQRLLGPGDTMVDVGSHVGQFALHAAQVVGPEGRVVAVEANPRTYQYLADNIALNEFTQVTPVLGAVAGSPGVEAMMLPAEGNWGGARSVRGAGARGYHALRLPLDTLLPAVELKRVDFLKIDVEGLELEVLRSLDMNSALRPRNILLEYIPSLLAEQGDSARSIIDFLEEHGYAVTDIAGEPVGSREELPEYNAWARDTRA